MKSKSFILLLAFLVISQLLAASSVKATDTIELTPTEIHHVMELNSNQPYVAGYHVNTPDLHTFEGVNATAITVSFPSTDTNYFPSDSWLGGGMFVQAQDRKIRNVDYAFYTMLVLDSSGGFFLDIGLHQTREATAPLQMPTSELIYAYTWRIMGIAPTTPVTLLTSWDSKAVVHYSLSASGANVTLPSINVAAFPNCASIIEQFWSGNVCTGAFPLGRQVHYFQFGVVSSKIIANNHWSVDLKDPRISRKPVYRLGTGWHLVENAWLTYGDFCYLDNDWMWGGAPYYGVSAKYHQNPLENQYEVIFFYSGQTLPPGTILWQYTGPKLNITPLTSPSSDPIFGVEGTRCLSIEIVIVIGIVTGNIWLGKQMKKKMKTPKTNLTG